MRPNPRRFQPHSGEEDLEQGREQGGRKGSIKTVGKGMNKATFEAHIFHFQRMKVVDYFLVHL